MTSPYSEEKSLNLPKDFLASASRKDIYVGVTSFFLVFLPIALNAKIEGIKYIFRSFAADTFFYLAVAKQSSWDPLFSFDGENPTNGFHPLWMWILKTLGYWLNLDSKGLIYLAFLLSWLFVSIATPILVACTSSITKRPLISLISFFPGLIYVVSSFSHSSYGNMWSFINGMESPISLALFALFVLATLRWKIFSANTSVNSNFCKFLAYGLLLSLITLARLDDFFLIISFFVITVLWSPEKFRLSSLIALSFFPFLLISSYLVFNNYYADSFIPISGIAKSGFGAMSNIAYLISLVFPIKYVLENDWGYWGQTSWRVILMILPAIMALCFLWKTRIKIISISSSRFGLSKTNTSNSFDNTLALLSCLSLYVMMKSIYNFLIVGAWHQGHWYYPVSIASANIIFAYLVSDYFPVSAYKRLQFFLALALIFASNIYIVNSIESRKAFTNYNMNYYDLWSNRNSLISSISEVDSKAKIVSFDDGIVAFSLDSPVLSGLGFALDKEAYKFAKKGSLLQFARSRGYQYVTSLNYMPSDLTQDKPFWLKDSDSKDISFEIFLKDPKSNLSIYRMKENMGKN